MSGRCGDQQVADRETEAVLLNNVGLLEQQHGNGLVSERSFQQALDINRAVGVRQAEASNLVNLGLLSESRERLDEARR